MATKATIPVKTLLSPRQQIAIDALVKGMTQQQAATLAGVTRQTVSEWYNHDPLFVVELNKSLNEVASKSLASHIDKVKETTASALDTVMNSIKAGDVIAARWLLDKVPILGEEASRAFIEVTAKPPTYPEDADTVINQMAMRMVDECLHNTDDLTRQLSRNELFQKARKALQDQFESETIN